MGRRSPLQSVLNFPLYLAKAISSFLNSRTLEASFQTATATYRHMRSGVAQVEIISPFLFRLHVNDLLSPSRHVELALYAIETAVIATSCKPALLVSYLNTYLRDLERWLREWRIAIKVSKIYAVLFAHPETQTSSTLPGASQMGRYRPLPCGDPLYKAHLVDS